MTEEEAEEYFSFNTLGAWVGEHTPLFLTRPHAQEDDNAECDLTSEALHGRGARAKARRPADADRDE
jgi:hypothetical protein